MKYFINDVEVKKDEFDSQLEDAVNNSFDEDEFDEMLDNCYPTITICGITFFPSQILKGCDPVAYRCYEGNEESFCLEQAQDDIEKGNEISLDGKYFRQEDDE